MRLTPEYVSKTPSHLNALKERELDLRGLAIPVIENLASHQGTYDTLNLSDNSLTVLGNIPEAPRVRQLHAPRNQISSISPNLPKMIPNLITLVLSDNAIASLSTLLPLESLIHLRHLSLRGNPVTEHPNYKEFVVWKVAKGSLHTLDYTRIKDSLRASSRALLLDPETNLPNALALQLSTSTAQVGGAAGSGSGSASTNAAAARAAQLKAGKGRLMTPEEKKRVVEALVRAKTADEVRRLERMLAEGVVPDEVAEEQEGPAAQAETDAGAGAGAGAGAEAEGGSGEDGDEGMQVEGQETVEEGPNGNGSEGEAAQGDQQNGTAAPVEAEANGA